MMLRNWRTICAATILLAAAGCGSDGGGEGGSGGSGGTGIPGGIVVCDLFTQAQIEGALGSPVVQGEGTIDSLCIWDAADFETGKTLSMQILAGGAQNFDATVEQLEESFGSTAEPLAGVGERAYQFYYEIGTGSLAAGSAQVGATQGNDFVMVTVGGLGLVEAEGLAIAKALTIQLLGKI